MIRWCLNLTVLPQRPLLSSYPTSFKDSTFNAIVEKLYFVLTEFVFSIHLSIDCGEETTRSPSSLFETLMMFTKIMITIIMVMIIMIKLMWMIHGWEEITRSQSPLLETFIRPRWQQLPIRTITFSNSISFLFWNNTEEEVYLINKPFTPLLQLAKKNRRKDKYAWGRWRQYIAWTMNIFQSHLLVKALKHGRSDGFVVAI